MLYRGMDIQRDDLKRKKRRRQWISGIAIGALLLGTTLGATWLKPATPAVERSNVWIDTVKRGEMLREVRGTGTLVPKEIRWIAAETNAHVERIVVKPGAQVQADTVLIELAAPEVIEQLESARAALAAARADAAAKKMTVENQLLDQKSTTATVQSEYETARIKAEAYARLSGKGIVSEIDLRSSQLAAEQYRIRFGIEQERIVKLQQTVTSQIAAEQARVDQLASTLALRERQAEALKVKAGVAGVLQQVPVQEGAQVLAGANLARIARPDVLRAELHVAETQAKDVTIGQSVKVDTRNGIVAGKVERIDPAVEKGSVQVDVDLVGTLPPGARPDLSVDGTIQIERLPDVIYVGRPAIAQANGEIRLFRLDANSNLAERIPVQLGRSSVNLIEILQGLKPGDQVVLSDTSAWDAYDRIRIQ